MDSYCIEELYFWRNNLNSIKVRDFFLFNKPQRFAYSDASATGCGSVITLNEDCVCHKLWEPSECSKSSTWRELAAIDFSLESFAPILEGSLVKWFTDSQTAARIIEVGSMELDLHRQWFLVFKVWFASPIPLTPTPTPTPLPTTSSHPNKVFLSNWNNWSAGFNEF